MSRLRLKKIGVDARRDMMRLDGLLRGEAAREESKIRMRVNSQISMRWEWNRDEGKSENWELGGVRKSASASASEVVYGAHNCMDVDVVWLEWARARENACKIERSTNANADAFMCHPHQRRVKSSPRRTQTDSASASKPSLKTP